MTASEPADAAASGSASIAELATALESGAVTAAGLVAAFRDRIADDDPSFNAVAFLNPNADAIAADLDAERAAGRIRGPLHGIPVLLKDNLDTGDRMMTTAGSLALDGTRALRDSHVVARLRAAGAVILGKTNLSEWANFRSARPATGWSSRGGQVRNAYAVDRTPGGSSSGSGVAVARGYCAAAIGTETDGSIVRPASMNALVGIKPTVGLIGRSGIVPIAPSLDTAGPMARTVEDAAILLSGLAGADPADPATAEADDRRAPDYGRFLDSSALRGARLGVLYSHAGFHASVAGLFNDAVARIRDAGATVVEVTGLPARSETRPIELTVLLTEFKVALDRYLAGRGPDTAVRSLDDVIAFNDRHAETVMPYYGQELMRMAAETAGLDDPAYREALATCHRMTREDGIDAALARDRLDALIAPTTAPPWAIDWVNGDHRPEDAVSLAAIAGYPSITVPMGYVSGLPVGLSFFGAAWTEPRLIGLAHAFERATGVRVPPGPPRRLLP